MDIVRSRPARKTRLPAILLIALALVGASFAARSLVWPTAPEPVLDRSLAVIDQARRAPLARTVRATGTLVARDVHVVAASDDGIVERIAVIPGSLVVAGATIAVLRNDALDAIIIDARVQVQTALAERADAVAQQATAVLDRDGTYRAAVSDARSAASQLTTMRSLHAGGLVADLTYQLAAIKGDETARQVAIDRRKIAAGAVDDRARVAIADAKVSAARAQLAALLARRASLVVRASETGVVQSTAVESGQRLAAGAAIARIASQLDLKAVVNVPEAQVRDVAPGARTALEVAGGQASGTVTHVDPAAVNGSVAVDVAIAGRLPRGARPDITVDATIRVEDLGTVVSIARPSGALDNTTTTVFKLAGDDKSATRTTVRLGRGPLDRIAVLAGLAPGDRVIVSDMSQYDGASRVRLR